MKEIKSGMTGIKPEMTEIKFGMAKIKSKISNKDGLSLSYSAIIPKVSCWKVQPSLE